MRILFLLIPLFLGGCVTTDYTAMRNNYIIGHPNLSEQTKQDIQSGTYRIGMTKEDVQAALGMPDIVLQYPDSKVCNALGCSETIKYEGIYLTFIDGKLASFYQSNAY